MLTRFRTARPGGERGLTYLEMMVVLTVLAVLAAAALPTLHWADKRRKERQLKLALQTMRDALDQYKRYSDEGLVPQTDVDLRGYPKSLEALTEGVEVGDPASPDTQTIVFLFKIPEDPFTEEARWGYRSYQDDWDSTSWGGENVYDVYSLSDLIALDGTYYNEW